MRILLCTLLLSATTSVGAQTIMSRGAEMLAAPGGRPVGTLRDGAPVSPGTKRGAYTEVTIEGYVNASALGAGTRSQATARSGARLRAMPSPNATVLADLRGGTTLTRVAKRGAWVRVRRTGWVRRDLLATKAPSTRSAAVASGPARKRAAIAGAKVATSSGAVANAPRGTVADAPRAVRQQAASPPPPAPSRPAVAATADTAGPLLTPARSTPLADAPEGRAVARLEPGAKMTPLARDRGWVRVSVEGWVLERDATAADSALRAELSAADLRADPDGTRGRVVRWDVQVLAFQVADPLRRDMAPDEPYLLARGPGTENALLYLAIPPSLVATARSIPSLTSVTVTARVRSGRSEPVGVPILDLQSLARR
jgi:SH3 domain-containing protein